MPLLYFMMPAITKIKKRTKGTCLVVLCALCFLSHRLCAQEFNCRVEVLVPPQLSAIVQPAQIEGMKKALDDLMNETIWSRETYQTQERLSCELTLTLTASPGVNTFEGSAQWQLVRPVYGSDYETVLFKYTDTDWKFDYAQGQFLRYNEGAPLDELTGLIAFYAQLMLGIDADSFAPLQGTPYFQNARRIANLVPSAGSGSWSQSGKLRSRYFLMDNLTDPQLRFLRELNYRYHLHGLDLMPEDPEAGRNELFKQLNIMATNVARIPPSILVSTWLDSKYRELIAVFSKGVKEEKERVYQLLRRMDPTRTEAYQELINN